MGTLPLKLSCFAGHAFMLAALTANCTDQGRTIVIRIAMKQAMLLSFGLTLWFCSSAIAEETSAPPAAQISSFRARHGEGKVASDPALSRIAQAQADAMASKDELDHGTLAPFSSRVASAGAERAAENIAYGYASFPKTLGQWIESPEHRKNLLLHGASRVGIGHAESTRTHRVYWAMEIAGGYERRVAPTARRTAAARSVTTPHRVAACRIKLLGLCL